MIKIKKITAIIVSLLMLFSIFQLNAFALAEEQAAASVNFSATRPTVGATPSSCRVTSSTALYPVAGYEYLEAGPNDTEYHKMSSNSTFKSGYMYRVHIIFYPDGPTLYPDITVNGNAPTYVQGSAVLYDFGTLGGSSSSGSSSSSSGGSSFGDIILEILSFPLGILMFIIDIIVLPFALIFGF